MSLLRRLHLPLWAALPLLAIPSWASLNGTWSITITGFVSGHPSTTLTGLGSLDLDSDIQSGTFIFPDNPCGRFGTAKGTIVAGRRIYQSVTITVGDLRFNLDSATSSANGDRLDGPIDASSNCLGNSGGSWSLVKKNGSIPAAVTGVSEAAGFTTHVSKGGYASLFGTEFAPVGQFLSLRPPYPTSAAGLQLWQCPNGHFDSFCTPQNLVFVSYGQVNFIFDSSTQPQTTSFIVQRNGAFDLGTQAGTPFAIPFSSFYPAMFIAGGDCYVNAMGDSQLPDAGKNCGLTSYSSNSNQAKRATITDLQGKVISSANPARIGGYYVVWLTGLGVFADAKPPSPVTLQIDSPPPSGALPPTLQIAPLYVGESSVYPALNQINFQIPTSVATFSGTWSCGDYDWELKLFVKEGPATDYAYLPVHIKNGDVPCKP